jgi:phosphatidylserine/phosphatidylglycerophosphate/cardiolipin synthase-like enzyme
MRVEEWFLSAAERGNPHSGLDRRRDDGLAWTTGNDVQPLIDGHAYFAALLLAIRAMNKGDMLMFTDWRGDPDERLDGPGSGISRVLCQAAHRGVVVKGLIWRSHTDRFKFSSSENDHLGEQIEAAGGECLRDMRVRTGGSHHQKFVVLRHPGRPHLDVAYVGGIDLCHGRHDDSTHDGDPQPSPIAAVYGNHPPWHDIQAAIRGPAVGEVEATFRERWTDPSLLSRNPLHRIRDLIAREDTKADPLPPQLADPSPQGRLAVQLLRTYPYRRNGYPFAPLGERSVARGYCKAVARARTLIYLEDQYLWSPLVVTCFADALRDNPRLHLIAVLPRYPDQDGRISRTPQLFGRARAMIMLQRAGGDRVAFYSPENHAGVPIYVHAKVCIIDDEWASIGSDNMSRRSWTHDSELTCAVLDPTSAHARDLRLRLAREHLQLTDDATVRDPVAAFAVFAAAATELQRWQSGDRQGERPAGRLLPYHAPELSRWTQRWSGVLYRSICDPDGRPRALRRGNTF